MLRAIIVHATAKGVLINILLIITKYRDNMYELCLLCFKEGVNNINII